LSFKKKQDQDPASFSWETQQIMKQALLMRYSLIPFWYTLHHQAAMASTTIAQPLFFEYESHSQNANSFSMNSGIQMMKILMILMNSF
jgi:alpha-glucosidase (family GH31 glycosyl hydrolase)